MPTHTFAIDTRWVDEESAGTGRYIESLVQAMLALDHQDRFHLWGTPLTVTAPNSHNYPFTGNYRRAWQLAWKTVGWPTVDLVGPSADLWHFTNYVAPPTSKPFVLTIYDLTFVKYPEFVESKNLSYLQQFVPDSLARAEHILVISEATRDALLEEFTLPAERVTVTPLACDPGFGRQTSAESLDRIKRKYGIEGDYFLSVGTLEPRKNLRSLLMAMAGMRRKLHDQLVVVGGQGWLFAETKELLRKLGLTNRVIFTGYVPPGELPTLYQGAKVFVFPSHYEGFGIPVLEAMAAGTAVVCSNAPAIPEVAGTAALYFDPEDIEALKLALGRALDDESLRARLVEVGHEQAKQFSWKRTAEQTLQVYQQVLTKPAR